MHVLIIAGIVLLPIWVVLMIPMAIVKYFGWALEDMEWYVVFGPITLVVAVAAYMFFSMVTLATLGALFGVLNWALS